MPYGFLHSSVNRRLKPLIYVETFETVYLCGLNGIESV
jgi:hypothetical protein